MSRFRTGFRFLLPVATLLSLAVLLAACGSDGGSSPSAKSTTAPATAEDHAATGVTTTALAASSSGAALQPLADAGCEELRAALAERLAVQVTMNDIPFQDSLSGRQGTGCGMGAQLLAAQFSSVADIAGALRDLFNEQGWSEDAQLAADGPQGTAAGFRRNDALCIAEVLSMPSEGAYGYALALSCGE